MWDLLNSLKIGRTLLLTTHYMDEADVLGDRIGIMSLGQIQCIGSGQYLKTTYGTGYKLVFDADCATYPADKLIQLTSLIENSIPGSSIAHSEDEVEGQIIFNLPFTQVSKFGSFFDSLSTGNDLKNKWLMKGYGVTVTSLEDIFLKLGEDHS